MAIHFDTQWPAPDGFHVPLNSEWVALCDILTTTFLLTENAYTMGTYLKMPKAGSRRYSDSNVINSWTIGYYWSSAPKGDNGSYLLTFANNYLRPQESNARTTGLSIRCFKDIPVTPTVSWDVLYNYGGLPEDGWIFWNSTDWLISVSADWETWITIQDKNLGATTVYEQWDTITDDNCWYFYQWGNNYWFAHSWSVTTSSTQVDTTDYWPWNYYNSSIFITWNRWSSVRSNNLWWWVSQWTWADIEYKLHWAIQTFHWAPHYDWYLNKATIAYYPLTEDLLDHKDNWKEPINLSVSWSGYSFGTNWFWQAWVQLTWSTYFYPWSWNVWGKHPWTDDMTIAFRVSNYSPAAYWGSWSWYHCWILSFGRQFKTWIMWDWVLGKDVGILDGGYEWFSLDSNYVWSTTENPKTLNWITAETYLNSYLSVVDTFHNWHHTRYISNIWASAPFCENDYASTKTVDVNYIWWDNYSSSNYRYFRWFMRDFVVSWDVWTPAMINAYFNEDLGGSYQPTANTTAWYKLETDANDYSWNNRNASWANVTYWTSWDLKYAIFNGSSSYLLANNGLSSWNYTVSVWIKANELKTEAILLTNWSGNNMQPIYLGSNGNVTQWYWIWSSSQYSTPNWTVSTSTWYNIVSVREWSTAKIYVNWQLIWSWSVTTNTYTDQWSIWAQKYYNQHWYNWFMSNLIIEDKARTASEIADYYNNTKSNYGL